MLVSEAPCAQAITLMPLRPNVPKSFPAMPGVCFIFSPTIAMVAKFISATTGLISPISISFANSSFNTSQANAASWLRTPMEVLFSEEAWDTMNTLMPFCANALKMRKFTPITPTMPKPVTVIRVVSLIEEIPLMAFEPESTSCLIMVPGASGLKVFFIRMGIFLWHTG